MEDKLVEGIKKGTITIDDAPTEELKTKVKALLEVTTWE